MFSQLCYDRCRAHIYSAALTRELGTFANVWEEILTRAFFVKNKIYIAFLLNSQAQGVSGKNEQSTQTPWRRAQCSCIGLRPTLLSSMELTLLWSVVNCLISSWLICINIVFCPCSCDEMMCFKCIALCLTTLIVVHFPHLCGCYLLICTYLKSSPILCLPTIICVMLMCIVHALLTCVFLLVSLHLRYSHYLYSIVCICMCLLHLPNVF